MISNGLEAAEYREDGIAIDIGPFSIASLSCLENQRGFAGKIRKPVDNDSDSK